MILRHSSGLIGTKGRGPSSQSVDFLAVLTESKSASCIIHFMSAGHSQWKMSKQPQNFFVKTLLAACTHNDKEYVHSHFNVSSCAELFYSHTVAVIVISLDSYNHCELLDFN